MKYSALKSQLRALGAPGLFAALALVLAAGLAWQGQRWEREAAADAARADRLRAELRLQRALAPASAASAAACGSASFRRSRPICCRRRCRSCAVATLVSTSACARAT